MSLSQEIVPNHNNYYCGSMTCLHKGGLLISNSMTPATSGAVGTTGQISWDGSYLYVCVGTNAWQRVATATW